MSTKQKEKMQYDTLKYDCIIFNWDYHYGCRGEITAFYASIVHLYIFILQQFDIVTNHKVF